MTKFNTLVVWLGGGVFVLSLAYFVWWFEFSLSASSASFNGIAALADTALFSAFALHHSLFARTPAKQLLMRVVPERLLRSTYVWIASLLFLAVCAAWQTVGGLVYSVSGIAALALAAVQVGGVLLIAAAVRAIDALELAGIRPALATPKHQRCAGGRDSTGLQVKGPYRLVRHPLYLGWMLAVFGAARMTGDRLLFAVISSAYLVVAVKWEEQALIKEFGAPYVRYTEQVRWRVVPFVF